MADSTVTHRFWFFLSIVFVLAIWLLRPILLPFVAGGVLAYLLDPMVKRLTSYRLPRGFGSLLVLLGFLFIVVLVLLLIVPLIQGQLASLIDSLPGAIETLRDRMTPRLTAWIERLSPEDVQKLHDAVSNAIGGAALWIVNLLKQLVSGGFALFDVVTLIVITPVVAFYFLRDWPSVTKSAESLVPRQNYPFYKQAMAEINRTLSGFLRGQALVCLCLGLIYGIGFSLFGLKYGATIGLVAGILSFIPYVGSTFALISSQILGFVQFDSLWPLLRLFCVFVVGQTLEGYVLTPKLVGDRVGLHPVWILFALFAGASLLGFVGVLIAVPVAAIVGVLVRLLLARYRASSLYERRRSPR